MIDTEFIMTTTMDPLGVTLSWPWLLCMILIGRLNGSALYLISIAALASFTFAEGMGLSQQIFGQRVAEFGPLLALVGVAGGALFSSAGAILGDNLLATAAAAAFSAAAKSTLFVAALPFRFLRLLSGKARGGSK